MRVIILLALLGAVMAAKRVPERIVGGNPTVVENYPYMANMQYLWWGILWTQWCGGTLINNRAVVSAAHCYEGDRTVEWRVRLGTSQASSGGIEFLVSNIINHPQYNDDELNNDIAIIWLANTATFSNSIQPAGVAGPNYNVPDNALVTTIGWGSLSSGGSYPNQLQEVDIYTINQELCAERYAYLKTLPGFGHWPDITPQMLCSGILNVGGKDACHGDSGGPLIHQDNVLIGVVSWGYSCADPFYPGVNARVSVFSDWIVANA